MADEKPTPEEIAAAQKQAQDDALRAELSKKEYEGLDAQQAYDHLHEYRVVTEDVQAVVPVTAMGLLEALSPIQSGGAASSLFASLLSQVQAVNRVGIEFWGTAAASAGLILKEQLAAMLGQFDQVTTTPVTKKLPPLAATVFNGVPGMPNVIDPADFAAVFTSLKADAMPAAATPLSP